MALQKTFSSPYSVGSIANAYFRIVETNLNFADSVGSIAVSIYADQAARTDGKLPIGSISITLSSAGSPALDADKNPLVMTDDVWKNSLGETVVPTYGPIPPFNDLIDMVVVQNGQGAGTKVFDIVKALLYTLLKTRPEFAGATDV